MSLVAGVELSDFGARSRHPESTRIFNAIVAGGLETSAHRSIFSELGNVAAVVIGWAAFVLFVFAPSTQLIALCLCGVGLLMQRDPTTGCEAVNVALDPATA